MRSSTFKDVIHVSESSIINLISSILTGFVIPMVLGTLNYGYYRIFALYASYTTLCHFGFTDGILLHYSGKDFNDLDQYTFRSNSLFFVLFELFISLIIISFSLLSNNEIYRILFFLLGINCFFQNLLNYYQSISQATLKFGKYSIVSVCQNLFLIVSVVVILFIYKVFHLYHISFIIYSLIIIFSSVFLVIWYFHYYKKITFGRHKPIRFMFKYFKEYFISGAYLTFGYGISLLIFNLDSQFVVKFFSVRTYAVYSFAYSMFSAGLIILNSASVVLLPHLKSTSKGNILSKYCSNISYVALVTCLSMIGYFPLEIVIKKWFPPYYGSLAYFKYLLPGIVLTCCVSIVISNYYYALHKVRFYFYLSLFVLFIAFVIDSITYILFKNPTYLAISSTISLFLWYFLSNHFITRNYHLNNNKNIAYIVIMVFLFLLISSYHNLLICSLLYLVSYIVISFFLFENYIITLLLSCENYLKNLF